MQKVQKRSRKVQPAHDQAPGDRRVTMGEVVVGGRRALRICEADPDGAVVVHARVPDRLARLAACGMLTPAMLEAAAAFAEAFHRARLSNLRCSTLAPPAGGRRLCGRAADGADGLVQARQRVHVALDVLGGPCSLAGSCVWEVVGEERSLNEWRLGRALSGRPMDWQRAQGILVAALEVLALRYGLQKG